MGLGRLSSRTGVYNTDNYVNLSEHCWASIVVARAIGAVSNASRPSDWGLGQVLVVARAGGGHKFSCRGQFQSFVGAKAGCRHTYSVCVSGGGG